MAAPTWLRISFALGAAGALLSIAVGGVSAVVESGRAPPLARHPLEPARDALAAGDSDGFVGENRMFVAIQARDARAYLRLADALVRSGDADGAIEVLETALELRPVPPVAYARLASLYSRQGRADEARIQARRAQEHGVKVRPELLHKLGLQNPPG